jgi:hypothetical protein
MRQQTHEEYLIEDIAFDLGVDKGRIGLERVGKKEDTSHFIYSIHITGDDKERTLYERVCGWMDQFNYPRVRFWDNPVGVEREITSDKTCQKCGTLLKRSETDKGHEMRITVRCPNSQCIENRHPRYSIIQKTPPPKMPTHCYRSTPRPKAGSERRIVLKGRSAGKSTEPRELVFDSTIANPIIKQSREKLPPSTATSPNTESLQRAIRIYEAAGIRLSREGYMRLLESLDAKSPQNEG